MCSNLRIVQLKCMCPNDWNCEVISQCLTVCFNSPKDLSVFYEVPNKYCSFKSESYGEEDSQKTDLYRLKKYWKKRKSPPLNYISVHI